MSNPASNSEVLALIAQAKAEGWTELDLSGQYLTELPPELGDLRQLEVLNLGRSEAPYRYNYLTALPDWIAQLSNIHTLDLRNNKLTALPDWLAQLTNLQSLDLRYNNLTALPDWIAQLTNLHTLKLGYANLTSLPEEMAQLTNLHVLDLSYSHLTALPDWMARLSNLCILNLSHANLMALPDWIVQLSNLHTINLSNTYLTSLPEEMAQLINLQVLDLSYNHLTALPDWIAGLSNLCILNLSHANLMALPDWIAQLSNLHTINLSNNMLTVLPDWISQLSNLQVLNLSSNTFTALSEEVAQLVNLHTLDLSNNMLTVLPDWMAQLSNLQVLNLSSNTLTALSEEVAQLVNLHTLDLSNNMLTVLPDWMAQLSNLQVLNLSSNTLTALPDWMADPNNLLRLQSFYIGENPITSPPAELLGESLSIGYGQVHIEAIRSYFRQLQSESAIYFYEAKLLIIGEGGAGKTSLARKLLDPNCALRSREESTEGIDILPWRFPLPSHMPDGEYTANIWDFGGQEVYFATHQFFLTKRSVYALVADTRRQHTDFYTWLRMQETFGGDSPVVLVKNRNRQQGNSFSIENLPHLQQRFPNLKEIVEVDLDEVPGGSGWQKLLFHLHDYLLNLPHIGQPSPATWAKVRSVIKQDGRDTVTWREFLALCQAQGMDRAGDIQQLAEYLHNLGDILYFHHDPLLCDLVILKPTWGLDAVYKVLDNRQIIAQLGKFSLADLRGLWNDPKYAGYHPALLRLMENFQLCYPLPDVRDAYIAPQLLDDQPPAYDWDGEENLQLRYSYPVFMPRGILGRAIVKLHKRIEVQRLVWRSGVILADNYARAEVLELRGEKQIRIRVSGRLKQDLLMEIV
ncbi:MAG: leucine-rich repeat domain-containing protein, partial [Caldilineaceae bacterium]|nr:leucine-rich repeat domain-containing protein [Caldilineaceae bacterium]